MKNFFGWFGSRKFLKTVFYMVLLAMLFPGVMLFLWPFAKAQMSGVSPFVRFAVALAWAAAVWIQVEPFMGVTRAFFGRESGSRGSGLGFLFQPFGIPIESVVREDEIARTPMEFEMTAETSERDAVTMKIVIEAETKADSLVNHNKMDDAKREKGIKDRVEGVMTAEVYKYNKRDDVYKMKEPIEGDALRAVRAMKIGELSLEEYFGKKINSIAVADIIQPKGIVEAEQEREKAEEVAKADLVRTEAFNKRVDLHQVGHPSVKGGGKLTRPQAVAVELLLSGKSKKEERVIEIGPNLQHSLGDAGKSIAPVVEWLGAFASEHTSKKPKKKKKKGE